VAGAVVLLLLQSRYQFALLKGKTTLQGVTLSAILATLLAMAIVIADIIIRYPQDTNVPIPQAFLFYPAVGFVAEIIFHILSLGLLLLALNPLVGWLGKERVLWLGILLVAVIEPTFQVLFGGRAFSWGAVYTWIHVFAIAFLQLYVFRRFDFFSMYSFRLFYYAYCTFCGACFACRYYSELIFCPTKWAPDWQVRAAFADIFLTSGLYCSQIESKSCPLAGNASHWLKAA